MKNLMKNKFVIIGLILFIYNIFLIFYVTDYKISIRTLVALFIEISIIILLYLIFKFKKDLWSIERKFIVSFFLIGIFYLLLFPIGSLPDEKNHFMRAYEISNGNLISDKCVANNDKSGGCTNITKEIENVIANSGTTYNSNLKKINEKYNNKSNKYKINITNISMYSFVCYIPQATGIFIGRMLNLPILAWAYLARLLNFIVFIFLLNFSIKKIPYKKSIIFFISLLPITLQEAVSMAADCMAIGSSLALISYVLKLMNSEGKINKKNLLIMGILSFLLSMSKLVYLPICLLPLLIPANKFENKKQKYIILLSIIFIVGIVNLIWLKVASKFLMSISFGANPNLQLKNILSHPFRYIVVIYDTICQNFDWYVYTMLGSSLGNLSINISPIYVKLNIFIMIFIILFNNEETIEIKPRLMYLFISFVIIILIFTSLYLDWSPVSNNTIIGVQGRYFIPILPLIILLLSSKNFNIKDKTVFNENILFLVMIMENICVLAQLLLTY